MSSPAFFDPRSDPEWIDRIARLVRERPEVAADLIARQWAYKNLISAAFFGAVFEGSADSEIAEAVEAALNRSEEFCPVADVELLFTEEIDVAVTAARPAIEAAHNRRETRLRARRRTCKRDQNS